MNKHKISSYLPDSGTFIDARAELFLAKLFSDNFQKEQIHCNFLGINSRFISHDIASFVETLNEETEEDNYEINLNREGFYDCLPECLFHYSKGTTGASSIGKILEEFKENAQIESETRLFFKPFEQEYLFLRTLLELKELDLLQGFPNNTSQNFYNDFWEIPDSFDKRTRDKIYFYLPYFNKMKGNHEWICECFSDILNKTVSIGKIQTHETLNSAYQSDTLGVGLLGNTILTSYSLPLYEQQIILDIYPVNPPEIPELINGTQKEIIDFLCGQLFEADLEIKINLLFKNEDKKLNLSFNDYLGVNTYAVA